MGKPRKKRTAEEEAAYREARRAADRERCRLRRLDPVYMASERIKKRQRRLDPEYAKRRREAEAARKRNQRQLTGLTEYQRWKARLAAGVPHPRLHRNQYTSCEKTVSKSTEANIVPKIHHVSTQIEKRIQGFYNACPPANVPQPIKGYAAITTCPTFNVMTRVPTSAEAVSRERLQSSILCIVEDQE
nr:uncharacterized protein LOC119187342 isoform X4 [Rhipicephalus microplus]